MKGAPNISRAISRRTPQTPMRVNLRLTTRGALSRHRCRGVRLRKQARLYYKMPADGPGGRLDLLVDPSSNLSTKYTFLYPGRHLIPRTSLHASQRYPDPDRGHCWVITEL